MEVMRFLKVSLVSLVTTTVLLPLVLIVMGAIRTLHDGSAYFIGISPRSFLVAFFAVFAILFLVAWILIPPQGSSTGDSARL